MEDSLASMVYNYKHGFSGFAPMLTEDHAHQLAGQSIQAPFGWQNFGRNWLKTLFLMNCCEKKHCSG